MPAIVIAWAGGKRGPSKRAIAMVLAGLALVALFFLMAPRSPARPYFEEALGGLTGAVAIILGVAGTVLVFAGRLIWLRESRPELFPREAAILLAIAVWVPIVVVMADLAGLEGVGGLLLVELALLPLLILLAMVFGRLLSPRRGRPGR